jgi:hypothetical protein
MSKFDAMTEINAEWDEPQRRRSEGKGQNFQARGQRQGIGNVGRISSKNRRLTIRFEFNPRCADPPGPSKGKRTIQFITIGRT